MEQTLETMNVGPDDPAGRAMAREYVDADFPIYGEDRDYGDFVEYGGGGTNKD